MPDQQPPQPQKKSVASKAGAWVMIATTAVAGFEGLRNYAYRDPVGIPTICFGETKNVRMGDYKSTEACKDLLAEQLLAYDAEFRRCAGNDLVDRMPSKAHAAYVSFFYNIGSGRAGKKDGFCVLKNGNKSSMLRYLQAGLYEQSCREFPKWATAIGGIKLPGLVTRRNTEMQFCLQSLPDWGKPIVP